MSAAANQRRGALVRLAPRPAVGGFEDRVLVGGALSLWCDTLGRHVPVPVGALVLVVDVLPTLYVTGSGSRSAVADVLAAVPGLGPLVVTTYVDRLREVA